MWPEHPGPQEGVVILEQTRPGLALTGIPTQIPEGGPGTGAVVFLGTPWTSAPCGTLPCPTYPRTTSDGCPGCPRKFGKPVCGHAGAERIPWSSWNKPGLASLSWGFLPRSPKALGRNPAPRKAWSSWDKPRTIVFLGTPWVPHLVERSPGSAWSSGGPGGSIKRHFRTSGVSQRSDRGTGWRVAPGN